MDGEGRVAFGGGTGPGGNCGGQGPGQGQGLGPGQGQGLASASLRRDNKRPKEDDDRDGEDEAESPVLDFTYADCDSHSNEIAELYSYTELPDFHLNEKAFENLTKKWALPGRWEKQNPQQKKCTVSMMIELAEATESESRIEAARGLLYLAQGCWAEAQSDADQKTWARENVMLLFSCGAFTAAVQLLALQMDLSSEERLRMEARRLQDLLSIGDSGELRIILSLLYTITEVMRAEIQERPDSEYAHLTSAFREELTQPINDELLAFKLFDMVTVFCSGGMPHFPMKKVLLLLWKVLLVQLGGSETLRSLKAEYRKKAELPPLAEDTLEVTKRMRPCSPPPSAADLIEAQNRKRRQFRKQIHIRHQEYFPWVQDEDEEVNFEGPFDSYARPGAEGEKDAPPEPPVEDSPPPEQEPPAPRGLPWIPKVRRRDIDTFLDNARLKFIGYTLPGDTSTLAGLPRPICEGVKILRKHAYVSLAEVQAEREIEIARWPLSRGEGEVEETQAELLYRSLLPNMTQHVVALLKIMLAAGPTSNGKTESVNIMADILPEEMPVTTLQSIKLRLDLNRHKEIITKAASAILLLLLKHFKLNHVYQFEFLSQHLVFANCIPLILKFFNQNIAAHISTKNVIPIIEFPACVIGEQPELTKENLDIGDTSFPYSWRNLFASINLLRILNKLIKWKHSRIMLLVVFKSAPILKRTLKVRHAMMQVYVLKLLKMQTKYLGRQWRKSNMMTISAIYSKVRHRFNDDWAFGNDVEAKPWDFQSEECTLRNQVDRFNKRRYIDPPIDTPTVPCLASVLSIPVHLEDDFKNNYEQWLEQEVYNSNINWDCLLSYFK